MQVIVEVFVWGNFFEMMLWWCDRLNAIIILNYSLLGDCFKYIIFDKIGAREILNYSRTKHTRFDHHQCQNTYFLGKLYNYLLSNAPAIWPNRKQFWTFYCYRASFSTILAAYVHVMNMCAHRYCLTGAAWCFRNRASMRPSAARLYPFRAHLVVVSECTRSAYQLKHML